METDRDRVKESEEDIIKNGLRQWGAGDMFL